MPSFVRPALCLAFAVLVHVTGTGQEKGLTPAETSAFRATGKTRAIVIGVSDYQFIDKLNYAHRDAEIFASFLYSQNISPADVVLLTNEQATHGKVTAELMRLVYLSSPGDNFIFYFSGHGDVEARLKKGYLLLHDSYKNNYMAGTLSVNDLRDIFETLCEDGVRVMVVTDACRAGNLAGGKDGRRETTEMLKPLWKNEIKILSSEPDQVSIEGPQWGDGRGVFSWFLISGMEGAADANQDSMITINELNQYVGNKVYEVTEGKQQPIIDGPNRFSTVVVNLKTKKPGPGSGGGESFIFRAPFFLPADSCDTYFRNLQSAINAKNFTGSPTAATVYYEKIKSCTKDRERVLSANSNLLSSMLNEAQVIINNSFSGKKLVSTRECEYADELLAGVLKFNDLKLPFETSLVNLRRYLRVIRGVTSWKTDSYRQFTAVLDSAVADEPDASYLTLARGIVELRYGNYTAAEEWLEKAVRLGPGWLMPKFYLGVTYGYLREYRKAVEFYEEVLKSDPAMKSFECAECIESRMKQYRNRLNRVNIEKYSGDKALVELENMRSSLADNVDSAYFFHEMARVSNRKNHPKRDSVYYFLSQAVTLDPWQTEYMYSLVDYMYDEFFGANEIRGWINRFLEWRKDDIESRELIYFSETLIWSYSSTKEYDKIVDIITNLKEQTNYDCDRILKKLRKSMSGDSVYGRLVEVCGRDE